MTSAGTGRIRAHRRTGLALLALCLPPGAAAAQGGGCGPTEYSDPPRTVLACADGLRVTAERGATYTLRDADRDGAPDAVDLTDGAVLVEYPARRRGGFQVRTPHAVASVRGTTWIVDAGPGASAIFVQAGRVRVGRTGRRSGAVVLAAGEGVDVAAGGGPLTVKTWGPERRLHLLARFGR